MSGARAAKKEEDFVKSTGRELLPRHQRADRIYSTYDLQRIPTWLWIMQYPRDQLIALR
ncbi:hypothetical protein [Bradyrhizobium sp. 5.13L]